MYKISDNAKAMLLLCTDLALHRETGGNVKPLTAREWSKLARVMISIGLQSPATLLEYGLEELRRIIGLSEGQAARLTNLMARGTQLAIELERLTNQGIWVLCRADEEFPHKLRHRLPAESLPPVLFGAGNKELLKDGFLSVVGSRDVDQAGSEYADRLGRLCAKDDKVIVSGYARGVDQISMAGCIQTGGRAIGVVADSLEKTVRSRGARGHIQDGRLTLISAERPDAPFRTWAAMNRNKLIYCLAEYGVVVAATAEKGGTWMGAVEVLKQKWVPLFVRHEGNAPEGNRLLLNRGALPLQSLQENSNLPSLLSDSQSVWDARTTKVEMLPLVATDATKNEQRGLFPIVWPHIASELRQSQATETLARRLDVHVQQLQDWLSQAVTRGMVTYDRQAERYSLVKEGAEPTNQQD